MYSIIGYGKALNPLMRKRYGRKCWLVVLAEDGMTDVAPKTWGGFHGVLLITSSYMHLDVQLELLRKQIVGW